MKQLWQFGLTAFSIGICLLIAGNAQANLLNSIFNQEVVAATETEVEQGQFMAPDECLNL